MKNYSAVLLGVFMGGAALVVSSCAYDPYLAGYYPVGYRPEYLYGTPHPHNWSQSQDVTSVRSSGGIRHKAVRQRSKQGRTVARPRLLPSANVPIPINGHISRKASSSRRTHGIKTDAEGTLWIVTTLAAVV